MQNNYFICVLIFCFSYNFSSSQNVYLSNIFFETNRQKLVEFLPESSVAVIFASSVKNRANDVDYKFHQAPNFYYLTGFNESDAVLLVFKNKQTINNVEGNSFLFVNKKQPQLERWTGEILGPKKTTATLLINALPNAEFFNISFNKMGVKNVLVNSFIADEYKGIGSETSLVDLQKHYLKISERENFKENKKDLSDFFAINRQIKTKEEIELIQHAVDITADGFDFMFKNFKPQHTEYQAQAMVEYRFTFNGAQYTGYPSICGGGNNATVLHYTTNSDTVGENQMILVDAGAEFNGYTADITRTFPANGKYTQEQKILYEIVLNAQRKAIEMCKIGNQFRVTDKIARTIITDDLKMIGLISNDFEAYKYFTHGTSHYVGLDVHDPGDYGVLQKNQIITVEPGIYIPIGSDCDKKWWGIGIRIEDDILITDKEPIVLSEKIPYKIADIEKILLKSQNKLIE